MLPVKQNSLTKTHRESLIQTTGQSSAINGALKSKINPCGQARNTMVLVAKHPLSGQEFCFTIQLPLLCNFFLKCFCVGGGGGGWGCISPSSPLKEITDTGTLRLDYLGKKQSKKGTIQSCGYLFSLIHILFFGNGMLFLII